MGEGPSGLIIKKPVRDLNRLIQFDFRESFKALTKIAVNAVAGNVPSALEGGAELLVARRAEADASEIAWLLIRRALGRAMAEVAVAALRGKGREPKDKDGLISALDLSLEAKEIVVSRSFFERRTICRCWTMCEARSANGSPASVWRRPMLSVA